MEEILSSGLPALGVGADEASIAKFRSFYEYLAKKSAVMNLTAIKGEAETARLHFLDCCALLGSADFKGKRVIDVGTGAGFPGLPLKLAEPGIDLTLLDSLQKRTDFLRESCELLGLSDVSVVCARAEEAPKALRESFDIAVSRAVARLNVLCELCLPFVKPGGAFIAMKGPECEAEAAEAQNAIKLLGGELSGVFSYSVPGTDLDHRAVIIRKLSPTPEKYPRRWAKISGKPL